MTIRLCLIEDDRVLFSVPLLRRSNSDEPLTLSDSELERLSKLYDIGSNHKRLQVMMEFAKGRELRFSDVLQIVTNPKLVQDSLQPMVGEGLLLHEKGRGYKPSEAGLKVLVVLTLGVGGILALVDREGSEGREH